MMAAPAPAKTSSSTPPPTPSQFDLWEQTRAVAADQISQEGNLAIWNVPASDILTGPAEKTLAAIDKFGPEQKGTAAARNEARVQDQISHFWATRKPGPLSQTDVGKLQDLHLQEDAYHNSKLRRAISVVGVPIPATGAGVNVIYERNANQDYVTLDQNAVTDAQQAIAKSGPTQSNVQALHNARLSVQARKDDVQANTMDLLGKIGGAGKLGPILRAKASVNDVAVALHSQHAAQATYTKTPNVINGMKVQIANLALRAARAGHESDKSEVATASLGTKGIVKLLGALGEAAASQSQSSLIKRAARMQRQVLRMQRAKAMQQDQTAAATSGNQVAQQMLALSSYGPATATTVTTTSST